MRQLIWILAFAALVAISGCGKNDKSGQSSTGSGESFEVQWPGGSVKIDPKEGVKVKAPGVDVQVDKEEGVGVKAPGVDVKIEKGSTQDE